MINQQVCGRGQGHGSVALTAALNAPPASCPLQGAAWSLSGVPAPPLDLRITDRAGRQILARWVGGSGAAPAAISRLPSKALLPIIPPYPAPPMLPTCRRVIYEAGLTGVFNSSTQFPLSGTPAGIAAVNAAALPELSAAVPLPEATVPAPNATAGVAGSADKGAFGPPAASAAAADPPSPSAEAFAPADVGQADSSPVVTDELLPLLVPTDAGVAVPGAACNASIMSVLVSSPAFSTFAALIRSAGEPTPWPSCLCCSCLGMHISLHGEQAPRAPSGPSSVLPQAWRALCPTPPRPSPSLRPQTPRGCWR